jgi:hypothetical protein
MPFVKFEHYIDFDSGVGQKKNCYSEEQIGRILS